MVSNNRISNNRSSNETAVPSTKRGRKTRRVGIFGGLAVVVAMLASLLITQPAQATGSTITGIVAGSGDFDKNEQDFDILLQAVLAADLAGTLDTAGLDVTVFAPKDWAFIQLARDLGYGGWDEAGVWNFLVGALTEMGGGDPIPVLTDVLTYHVLPGAQTFDSITSQTSLTTLLGAPLGVHGTTFLDNDPGLTDSRLINWQSDIAASNGIVQVLDRVLIPINITGGGAS